MMVVFPREKGMTYAVKLLLHITPRDEYVIAVTASPKLFEAFKHANENIRLCGTGLVQDNSSGAACS
jgi:hypothetical protein